jgi:predicted metalloprotease with PDZ domain
VERIRPASLEPFSFDHANMSGELWFAEGFTSYYDDLSLVRAGILSTEDYAEGLAGQLNYVLLRPGRDHRNAIEMSQQAPFVDAATANDPNNFGNTFVSYYPYGATIGLALDLTLRERGHTLDEVMQLIWQRYGKTEIPYHIRDLQLALGEVVGDQAWAKDWFARYVYKSELPDLGGLMDNYGFIVESAKPDSVGFMGFRLRDNDGEMTVRGSVAENSPLYAAGLDQGSIITNLNGQPVTSQDSWDAIVRGLEVGKTYEIGFQQLGQEKTGRFTASVSPQMKVRFEEGKRKAKKAREAWLWR